MTVKEFVDILRLPYTISTEQVHELDEIVHEYPYFQAARVLQLKILHSEKDYRYSKALKLAAVHVTDRSVLFDFINSKTIITDFAALRRDYERIRKARERAEEEFLPPKVSYIDNDLHGFRPKVPDSIFEEPIFPEDLVNHQELAAAFVPKETPAQKPKSDSEHISEWLENISADERPVKYKDEKVAHKFELIDKFLESNPKIEASKDYVSNVNLANEANADPQQLMTETLAQVYVNQRKYKQAIQAYEILILKYPEKSRYFAAEIERIKQLQENN